MGNMDEDDTHGLVKLGLRFRESIEAMQASEDIRISLLFLSIFHLALCWFQI